MTMCVVRAAEARPDKSARGPRDRAFSQTGDELDRSIELPPTFAAAQAPSRRGAGVLRIAAFFATAFCLAAVAALWRHDHPAYPIAIAFAALLAWLAGCWSVATVIRLHRDDLIEMRGLKEAAEDSNRMMGAFIARASHAIRTPATAIVGYADLLAKSDTSDAKRAERLHALRLNAGNLLTLIDDIVGLSNPLMTVGGSPERLPCQVVALVGQIISIMMPRAVEKRLSLQLRFIGPVPATIRSDAVRLRHVLLNLLGNAIKRTKAGGVTLCLRLDQTRPDAPALEFSVSDTGSAVERPALSRLPGDPTPPNDDERHFEGLELGLSLCRNLIGALGGELAVTSESGNGNHFTFDVDTGSLRGTNLIAEPPRHDTTAPADPRPIGNARKLAGRVLVAEDDPANANLIGAYLADLGLDCSFVGDGEQAVRQASLGRNRSEPFDLILMDVVMPIRDGYSATTGLRNQGDRLPIVALTASASAADRDRCMLAGCVDVITKPIDPARLYAVLARYLKPASVAA